MAAFLVPFFLFRVTNKSTVRVIVLVQSMLRVPGKHRGRVQRPMTNEDADSGQEAGEGPGGSIREGSQEFTDGTRGQTTLASPQAARLRGHRAAWNKADESMTSQRGRGMGGLSLSRME